ncbi:MAG: protein kinase [Chloroflexota bacterium]|nr:protein kinase [Chloroflexota bacterium]
MGHRSRLELGAELFGCRVLEYVGEGACSYVYKAHHSQLSKSVAMKELKQEWVEDRNKFQRFLREVDIVSKINHPSVVQVHSLEHDEKAGIYCLITEFSEKGNLAGWLSKSPGGLPIDQVIRLGMGICSGLEAVHRAGIIHRDIKPGNVLLFDVEGGQDVPKSSDFGIAQAPTFTGIANSPTLDVVDVFHYMSPEQLDRDVEIDQRSDLYSLGILLYELVTGKVPFTGSVPTVFWAHTYMLPTPPSELRSDIPDQLEQIVLRALCKDREERYQSAADMHEALKAAYDVPTVKGHRRKFKTLLEQGLIHLKREEWEKAIEALGQADALEPGDERVQTELWKACEQQTLRELYELGFQSLEAEGWREAQEYLARLVNRAPDYADGRARKCLERAMQELRKGKGNLEPGTELFDYRVLECVGGGAWSYVYKAQDRKLPRLAAIKQLKPELVKDEKALKLFLREADIVARISHPNIVTIYDLEHDEEDDSHYIITEFSGEGTLADRLEESPEGLPIEQVIQWAMGICSGLEAAHRVGIIHRDIKPGNILLFNVGENQYIPKLSDFGIAGVPVLADVTVSPASDVVVPPTAGMVGTFHYMSPEQWDEDVEIDQRSDLYSLGILLYELITGRVPFTGDVPEVFWAHMYVEPLPPREFRADIPEPLEEIVLQALRKDRKERYQSAADMHEALKAIVDTSIEDARQRRLQSLLEQGQSHLKDERWGAAINVLEQADILDPRNAWIMEKLKEARDQQKLDHLYDLGTQYLEKESWEEAREHLADVIALDPDYADGRAREQLEQATQELERERKRRDLEIRYRTGIGYFRKQQWALAVADLEWVVDQNPGFKDATARLVEAREYVHAEQLVERARRHREQGEWEDAVDLFEEVWFSRLPHLDVTDELELARDRLRDAKKQQELVTWYDEGMVQLAAGELEQAKASFEKITRRHSDYRDVTDQLEEIEKQFNLKRLSEQVSEHEAAGEWEQVIGVCSEILSIDPLNREASRCLERAQRRVDRTGGFYDIAAVTRAWWDDRDRRAKVALVRLFVVIALALCVVAASAAEWPPVLPFIAMETPTPTLTPINTLIPISTPTSTPTPTPTSPTPTPTPTTAAPTPTPTPTTAAPTPTPTPTPTPAPVTSVIVPELVAPAQGSNNRSPVTFEWSVPLNAGQECQVTAYHPGSGHAIQSELLTEQSWLADLPGDKYGAWRWRVSVVQNGRTVTTSSEWTFWFDPFGPRTPKPPPEKNPPSP